MSELHLASMKNPLPSRRSVRLTPSLALLAAALTTFAAEPAKTTVSSPQWLRQGTIYEIFPRDFSPEGNFNGITAHLDELKDLGVNVLWLMPINPPGEKLRKGTLGSPYAVRDYYAINPDYGTEADLKRLISEAHRRGLKVIIDIVANHTAWDSVLMQHPEFYKHDASGKIIPPNKDWTDVAGLNYANPELRQYMITMLKHWIDPATFDLDGFRCDVASEVPTDFWEQARAELIKVKPDIILLAEASKPDLLVNAFNLDYSWPLHSTLNDVLLRGAPASELQRSWEESRRSFPQGCLHLRFSDNHDEARAIARFGCNGALAASAFMFTLDGVPLLYNGMEAGDATESGDPALFEKMPIFWHSKDRPPFRAIYKDLIRLRRQYPAFCNDRLTWLHNSNPTDLVSFLRQNTNDSFVVVVNFSNRPLSAKVDVEQAEQFKPLRISGLPDPPANDFPQLHLKGFEWRIYHRSLRMTNDQGRMTKE